MLWPAPTESLAYGCPIGSNRLGAACHVSIDRPRADRHLGRRGLLADRLRVPSRGRSPL